MKGPLFYSKILLFGEYGIIKDSKGLSIPYNFYNGALKVDENPSDEAIKLVKKYGIPIVLQFDHDLGGDDTSMVFIDWLINYMLDNDLTFHKNFRFDIHSQNPVGVLNIKSKMDSFIKSIS